MWALGNIAGDYPKCRGHVLGHGAIMKPTCSTRLSMLNNATRTLFCGELAPPFEKVN